MPRNTFRPEFISRHSYTGLHMPEFDGTHIAPFPIRFVGTGKGEAYLAFQVLPLVSPPMMFP